LINFEISKTSSNERIVGEKEQGYYPLKCKIFGDTFMFKREETTMFSKWIDHIKSHYVERPNKKIWIARDIVHLNYDSVLLLKDSNHRNENKTTSSSDDNNCNYRELTKREIDACRNALRRIRTEESMTKSKGR
jgi:hypothetical protein